MFDNFLHFLRIFALEPFLPIRLSLQNTSPYILIVHVENPYTAVVFLDPPPENYPKPINK